MELRAGISLAAIEQWGKILGDTVNLKIINFPVSFNECFGGLALFNGDPVAAAEYATITDITNTNFKIYMYANNAGTGYANANIFYLFLGAQPQWGFTVFDPVYYKNVNFTLPLSVNGTFCAFSTGYDAKGSTFLWHSMSHFNNVNVGVTGFVFDSRYTFTGLGYLAVCWQKQWGYQTVHGTNPVTYDLPIPFEEAPFTVAISTGNSGNHASCGGFTKTTIVLRAGTTAGVWDTVGFFIIGCQLQWGKPTVRGNNIFPIPFPNSALAITSAGIGGWHTVDVSIVNNNSYSVLGWATDSPSAARTSLPNVIAIGF